MSGLPWTKFQDFYLRLGFLKAMAAALSPQRRSALNDAIIRRLQRPLFDPASEHSDLWRRVKTAFPEHADSARDKWAKVKYPTVAEALLVDGNCDSLLFAITGPTAYKILDWGRDVGFVGRGNQITERGLLLRHLLNESAAEAFLAGNVDAWNPFRLTSTERNFFLYHLIQIDEVIAGLIDRLGELGVGGVLESRDAARLTCRTLIDVLIRAKDKIQPRDILSFRTASELASTIADELGMGEDAVELVGRPIRRAPKAVSTKMRRQMTSGGVNRTPRRANKNADHQTIPRFEQLVDLGFLVKPGDDESGTNRGAEKKRWRYAPTDACRRWAKSRVEVQNHDEPFSWHSFARTCLLTFDSGRTRNELKGASLIAKYLWTAYERVRRPAGPNPFDSVALFAMLDAIEDGMAIEIVDFHRLLLTIKQQGVLPDHVFFSSGNDIDQMFIQLRPGFIREVERREAMLDSSMAI